MSQIRYPAPESSSKSQSGTEWTIIPFEEANTVCYTWLHGYVCRNLLKKEIILNTGTVTENFAQQSTTYSWKLHNCLAIIILTVATQTN